MKKKRPRMKIALCTLLCLSFLGSGVLLGINAYVKGSSADQILLAEDAAALSDVDCILVLGCFVHENGHPSDMLADRLQRGIELYEAGTAPKLLMSGDHGQKEYNEVGTMKQGCLLMKSSWIMPVFQPMRVCTGQRKPLRQIRVLS